MAVEADDFGIGPMIVAARDFDAACRAHGQPQACGVQHQTGGARDAAGG
ncbi:hypothetical protein D556_3497 [Bordetella holmesii 41130]|nr:hypothetical protein D556_3497 [Bordetella holmesii 41130]